MAACGWMAHLNGKIFSGVRIQTYFCLVVALLLVCVMSGSSYASPVLSKRSVYPPSDRAETCSPKKAELSCIVGCFKCANTYGRKTYDMTRCCSVCQQTKALLIDDGPEFCSSQFFNKDVLNG